MILSIVYVCPPACVTKIAPITNKEMKIRWSVIQFKIIFSPDPSSNFLSLAQEQTVNDAISFSREMGFQPVLSESYRKRPGYYIKLASTWKLANVFLAVYPLYCGACFSTTYWLRDIDMQFLDFLHLWRQKTRAILFVDDLPIEQALAKNKQRSIDKRSYEIEEKIFRLFDVLCVYTQAAKKAISERYDVPTDKFVDVELRDYGVVPSQQQPRMPFDRLWKVIYAGEGERAYSGEWAKNLPQSDKVAYEFIGANWEWISETGRDDLSPKGAMSQRGLCDYVSKYAHFGIVAYSDKINEYSKYICPSKFSAYLAAGVPIIASSRCESVATLVKKYQIGISLNSFDQLPGLLRDLSLSDYEKMRKRCSRLARLVSNGFFFKRAITEATDRLGAI